MARRRYPRNYKTQCKVATKDMDDAGGQILLGSVSALDAQLNWGYLNNIVISAILNGGTEADPDQGGMIFYLTTNSTWSDSDVITARAYSFGGGSVSLSAKRRVSGAQEDDKIDGKVYLWGEVTDVTLTQNVSIRYVAEVWGRFLTYVAA